MSTESTTQTPPGNLEVSADSDEKYYTEGVIKELQIDANNGTVKLLIEPSNGYSLEVENKGEKKTVVVLRSEKSAKQMFANRAAYLYAGDFVFSIDKKMDEILLSLKINRCRVRVYVDAGKVDALIDTLEKSDNERRPEVVVTELCIK